MGSLTGAVASKSVTEALKGPLSTDGNRALECKRMVGERRIVGRSESGSTRGRDTSENAGMSSENYVRIIMAESLRFLKEGSSASR